MWRKTRAIRLLSAVISMASGLTALTVFSEHAPTNPPSCVHEIRYESFAGLIMVKMTIADSPPLDFVLDSGATQSFLTDPVLATALGLEIRELGLARGMGSAVTPVLVVEGVSIRNGGFEVLNVPLVIHDIGTHLKTTAGREIHGFLGADLFERFVVEINPEGNRLLLHDPLTFAYEDAGHHVPLEVVDRRPVVRCNAIVKKNGKEVPIRLVADTGSSRSLSLITKSARHIKPPADHSEGTSVGVVGRTKVIVASTQRLQLGPIVAEDVETTWVSSQGIPAVRNIPNLNGILGNRFLSQYRVFFDYGGNRLILGNLSNPS